MRQLLLVTFFLIFSPPIIMAQFFEKNLFYAGFLGGGGKLNGTESLVGGPYPNQDYATLTASNTHFAMALLYSSYGEGKLSPGIYAGGTLGGGITNSFYDISTTTLEQAQQEMLFHGDLRFGLQLTFNQKEKKFLAGIRYFNWYMGEGLRSFYGNSDDGATLGLYSAYKRIGVDLNFAPKKFPGVLVQNKFNIFQLEARFKALTFDDGEMALLVGTRAELSGMRDRATTAQGFLGYESFKSRMFSILLCLSGN